MKKCLLRPKLWDLILKENQLDRFHNKISIIYKWNLRLTLKKLLEIPRNIRKNLSLFKEIWTLLDLLIKEWGHLSIELMLWLFMLQEELKFIWKKMPFHTPNIKFFMMHIFKLDFKLATLFIGLSRPGLNMLNTHLLNKKWIIHLKRLCNKIIKNMGNKRIYYFFI